MTQKQFNALKAQIDKTNGMIEKATTEVKASIEKRVDEVVKKLTIGLPNLVQTLRECGLDSLKSYDGKWSICLYTNEDSVTQIEIIFQEIDLTLYLPTDIPLEIAVDVALSEEYKREKIARRLQKNEEFVKDFAKVQSDIRENAIREYQKQLNGQMRKLTELQAV